jgi:hypothetical protein
VPSPELPSWFRVPFDRGGLTQVVRHLARATRKGRERLATDILTIAYLDAGRRLFERLITDRPEQDQPRRSVRQGREGRPTLRWLTREMLFSEVRQGPHPFPRMPTAGTFRDRWRTKNDYTADLVAYLLWSRQREMSPVEMAREAVPALVDPGRSLAGAIEEAAYRDHAQTVDAGDAGRFRAQVALQSFAAKDPAVAAGLRLVYEQRQEAWRTAFQATLDGRGYRLRPDVSVDMLATALTAAVEGLGLRAIAEGPDQAIDHDRRTSLLGTIAMALTAACVDQGDGRPLRELVDGLGSAVAQHLADDVPEPGGVGPEGGAEGVPGVDRQ